MIFKIKDEWKNFEKDPIVKIGSILYVIGMFFFIYSFTVIITNFGKISLLIGCIFLVVFAWYELKQNAPVFNFSLFKNVKFASSNIASLLSYLALIAITTLLNYHFQYVRGFDVEITGFILIVTPVCMVTFIFIFILGDAPLSSIMQLKLLLVFKLFALFVVC